LLIQVILGSGGAIGTALAKTLKNYTAKIRIVSRSPKKSTARITLFCRPHQCFSGKQNSRRHRRDLSDRSGLPYKIKVWQEQWPVVMQNTTNACKQHNAKLIFFDNIYLYTEKTVPHLTEDSPVAPPGKKGTVRAAIAKMIMDEVKKRVLTAMIVRAADFYGPGINNSLLQETAFKP
jgi:nucleoside-diphosphate-sugar epimerase